MEELFCPSHRFSHSSFLLCSDGQKPKKGSLGKESLLCKRSFRQTTAENRSFSSFTSSGPNPSRFCPGSDVLFMLRQSSQSSLVSLTLSSQSTATMPVYALVGLSDLSRHQAPLLSLVIDRKPQWSSLRLQGPFSNLTGSQTNWVELLTQEVSLFEAQCKPLRVSFSHPKFSTVATSSSIKRVLYSL